MNNKKLIALFSCVFVIRDHFKISSIVLFQIFELHLQNALTMKTIKISHNFLSINTRANFQSFHLWTKKNLDTKNDRH